jgi:hypothetical protein
MDAIKVGVGTRFHSILMDGNPLWEVTRPRGKGVWEAKVVESLDHLGTKKVFTTEGIRRSVGMERMFVASARDSNKFYADNLGKVIHYHNSFGQFVRCLVVMGTTVHNKEPHPCAKPIALVGKWGPNDLPKRLPNGEVRLGYHAESIAKGECFEPHSSCIYEAGGRSAQGHGDPAGMPEIDLSVPPITSEQEKQARLWKATEAARAALDDYKEEDPAARLAKALDIIKGALS